MPLTRTRRATLLAGLFSLGPAWLVASDWRGLGSLAPLLVLAGLTGLVRAFLAWFFPRRFSSGKPDKVIFHCECGRERHVKLSDDGKVKVVT